MLKYFKFLLVHIISKLVVAGNHNNVAITNSQREKRLLACLVPHLEEKALISNR